MSSLVIQSKRIISFSPEITTKYFPDINEEELKIATKIPKNKSKTLRINSNMKAEKNGENDQDDQKLGEYYGSRMGDPHTNITDDKEKRIIEFLEAEKVEWGDPAEKCFNYYNEKKVMIQKKNMSCSALCNSNGLDMEASPLMMRRKLKANTMCGLGGLRLKETYSADNLTKSEKLEKKTLPTKFKLALGDPFE